MLCLCPWIISWWQKKARHDDGGALLCTGIKDITLSLVNSSANAKNCCSRYLQPFIFLLLSQSNWLAENSHLFWNPERLIWCIKRAMDELMIDLYWLNLMYHYFWMLKKSSFYEISSGIPELAEQLEFIFENKQISRIYYNSS